MRCPRCREEGAVLVRVGALRCTACGVVDPDGETTTEQEPVRPTFAPPPVVLATVPSDVPRKAGAWRVALVVPVVGGICLGLRGALYGSTVWLGVALVSALAGVVLSWEQIRRSVTRP